MKYVFTRTKRQPSVSDAALARARRALSKVAYSPEKAKDIVQAAQALPDVTVMAGGKLTLGAGSATGALTAAA